MRFALISFLIIFLIIAVYLNFKLQMFSGILKVLTVVILIRKK